MTSQKLHIAQTITTEQDNFPIVGIGASAGGLEALEQFFGNMPGDTGMAFVVIQHLDPNNPGMMPELMQRTTPMKVMQASDRLKIKPDCVYVIPPNKSLSLLNNALMLFDPVESRGLRLPIDVFFRSMAIDRKDKSIAIVLSGMGSDGSQGIKAIKEENGMVLVQDPEFAKFDSMPSSAINAVIADIIAPADELPLKLIELLRFVPAPALKEETDQEVQKNKLDKIIVLLRDHVGHDFSLYKKNTLIRRIERRKGIHKMEKISDYVRFLQENPNEIEILFKELLIGVTNFFRDPDLWNKLKSDILPALLDEFSDVYTIRIWVTACSTGEEAYSIAILLKELIEETKRKITLQIFASDLEVDAIEKARKGYYNNNIIADVSPERLNRFFTMEGEGYRVNTSIREIIVFAQQNVIKDPPFTKLDMIFCRNMLIYMETELQRKLMALFNFSLNSGGILVLGSAETIGGFKDGFKELDPKLKIYKHTNSVSVTETVFPSVFNRHKAKANEPKAVLRNIDNIQSLTDNIILQRFAPASVLVNEKGDIIYITGRTGKYLEPVAGKANWNIYAMAREGLRHELPGAFRKVMQNYEALTLQHLKIGTDGGTHPVDVILQRIEAPQSIRGSIIIVFKDLPFEPEVVTGKKRKVTSSRQRELEIELQRSYEELQSTREEMQTSQEELRSINEELQSTNEELQSTNEELTTSKEEMQSLNEELQTVNMELQSKVNDYVQSDNDMKNLLNSTEIAILFLDKELNIRRFTDSLTKIFKLRTTDIGRPITDLVTNLQYPDIDKHARQVLKTLSTIESPVSTLNSRWYNTRIMPYRTSDDRIDGLVITFTDISKHKLLEIELNNLKKQHI
jgi:two-component system CheB/CheR fusion protein